MLEVPSPSLLGQKALVPGIASENSIVIGCVCDFRELHAEVAIVCAGTGGRSAATSQC